MALSGKIDASFGVTFVSVYWATNTVKVYTTNPNVDKQGLVAICRKLAIADPLLAWNRQWNYEIVVEEREAVGSVLRCDACQTELLDGTQCDCTKYD